MERFGRKFYEEIWGTVHRHDYAHGLAMKIARLTRPGARVLDIGTGCGYAVKVFREAGYDAWGIDMSSYAIVNSCAPDHVRCASVLQIPFPARAFDLVISHGMLEYVAGEDLPRAFSELARVGGEQWHAVDFDHDPWADGFSTREPLEFWRGAFREAGICNLSWEDLRPRVLLACPQHECKEYAFAEWIDRVEKIRNCRASVDLLVIDNSPTDDFAERWQPRFPGNIDRLNLNGLGPNRRIAASMEDIRKRFLAEDYDHWFLLESDVMVGPDMLRILIDNASDWTSHYYPNRVTREVMTGFGCSLFSRRIMEENNFVGAPEAQSTDGWWWHTKIKGRPYRVVELYGFCGVDHR